MNMNSLSYFPAQAMTTTSVGLALTLLLSLTSGAHASEAGTLRTGAPEGISVSMVIDRPTKVGEVVRLAQLDLTVSQRADIQAQRTPKQTPTIAAATSGYDVVSKWKDKSKKTVYLRRQAHQKIKKKHNLTAAVVKKVTKSASWKGRAPGTSKTKYNYNLNFGRFICYPNRCILKEEVMVLTVVDFRSLGKGKGSYGVVTSYCETGKAKCPDYVKKAVNL